MVAEILALLQEIPLGKYKMEIWLQLRQAMLINGILYNSEVWHNINEAELLGAWECWWTLEVPIFKKCFQKPPSHFLNFLYTWKTTTHEVLSRFDKF